MKLSKPDKGTSFDLLDNSNDAGQRLWGRGRPPIDEDQALYATVKVKKAIPSGSTRPSLQVTAPLTQVKSGSELKARTFDLCPYRYYGRLEVFRKPLCHFWEQKAKEKVQNITFNRGMKSLPIVHNQAIRNTQAAGSGVVGIAGPKGNVILAGVKNLDAKKLQQLYDRAVAGQSLSTEGQVEGQGSPLITALKEILRRAGVPPTIITIVFGVVELWHSWEEAKRKEIEQIFVIVTENIHHPDEAKQQLRFFYENNATFHGFMDKIVNPLRSIHPDSQDPIGEAIELVYQYLKGLWETSKLLRWKTLIDDFGIGIVLAWSLMYQLFPPPALGAPSLATQLLEKLIEIDNRPGHKIENLEVLILYLAATAAEVFYYGAEPAANEQGREGIERVSNFLLILVPQMQAMGWTFVRIMPEEEVGFGFGAVLSNDPGPYKSTYVYGILEPHLKKDEIDKMIRAIQGAVITLNAIKDSGECDPTRPTYSCGDRYFIVQVIQNAEAGAVTDLCSRIQSDVQTHLPIVVIGPDGQVACFMNTSKQEADELCRKMGYCGPTAVNAESAEPITVQVPMPPPPEVLACPKGKVCLL